MNWLTGWKKKIGINVKKIFKKQSTGNEETGDFKSCPQCKKISERETLIKSFYICECSWHFPLPPKLRLDNLFDSAYEIIEAPKNINSDPLNFVVEGRYTYSDKIKAYKKKTNQETAILAGTGLISGMKAVVAVFNPLFGGGRFGVHENEHFLKIANYAVQEKVEFWLCCYASSGIDVHGGITALYGMPKSIIAMNEINKANIPSFALASRGTAGGTYASSFFMHNFIFAESASATDILFSGKRVTSNILKSTEAIPETFGTGLGVYKAGMVDGILNNRKEIYRRITQERRGRTFI